MSYSDYMSEPQKDETTVVGLVVGLILIKRDFVWINGAQLGGDFMLDPCSAGGLVDQLEIAAADGPEAAHEAASEHLAVFVRGGDHGEPINVTVHNHRESSAPHGRLYGLIGVYPAVAPKLAADLRAVEPSLKQ
jgi:hypothetical protein